MDGHSPDAAFARINAALDRIEAAATSDRHAGNDELTARHDHLRAAVAESLRAMDAFIAGEQP